MEVEAPATMLYRCSMARIRRNAPCPCGSGKKYKKCHGDPLLQQTLPRQVPPEISQMIRQHQASELIRRQQQGAGRPIISTDFGERKLVAVGSTIHHSRSWRFFPDFLADYIKIKLGGEWGNAELAKPLEDRHPILQWYDTYCHFQRQHEPEPDGTYSAEPTGIYYCYIGLAYNLYLLDHNAELQDRFIERLKRADQFQGAYYELAVANCLIRSGFELELEDETDDTQKHCEFSATSLRTGRKFWIEAKMRSVAGLLGKTDADGMKPTAKPTGRLTKHINDALAKPAKDDRIIFIDVNAEPITRADFSKDVQKPPKWMLAAEAQLDAKEKALKEGEQAYVFVTNMSFHRMLNDTFLGHAAVTYGLGIPDYGKPRFYSLKNGWRAKQKHIDLFRIRDALDKYPQIPNFFDGGLPPTKPHGYERIQVGKKYDFTDAGIVGTVTSAVVMESAKQVCIAVHCDNGSNHLLSETISDEELAVYRAHPEAYFGVVRHVGKDIKEPYEFFEYMVDEHREATRERLLEMVRGASDIDVLRGLGDEDLLLEVCERMTIVVWSKRQQ